MMPEMDGLALAREIRLIKPRDAYYFSDCKKSEG